jgi:hypothetical protein
MWLHPKLQTNIDELCVPTTKCYKLHKYTKRTDSTGDIHDICGKSVSVGFDGLRSWFHPSGGVLCQDVLSEWAVQSCGRLKGKQRQIGGLQIVVCQYSYSSALLSSDHPDSQQIWIDLFTPSFESVLFGSSFLWSLWAEFWLYFVCTNIFGAVHCSHLTGLWCQTLSRDWTRNSGADLDRRLGKGEPGTKKLDQENPRDTPETTLHGLKPFTGGSWMSFVIMLQSSVYVILCPWTCLEVWQGRGRIFGRSCEASPSVIVIKSCS